MKAIPITVAAFALISFAADQANATRSGQPLLRGVIVDSSGEPQQGALVEVTRMGRAEDVGDVKVGHTYPLTTVMSVHSDSHGRFVIPPLKLPHMGYTQPDGDVNLQLTVLTPSGSTGYGFAATPDRQGYADKLSSPRKTDEAVVVRVPRGAHPDARAPMDGPGYHCTDTLLTEYQARDAVVGATYTEVYNDNASFVYNSGGENKLGIGISSSGGYGTYSVQGYHEHTTASSQGYPESYGPNYRAYESAFKAGKYKHHCVANYGTGQYTDYHVQVTHQAGGNDYEDLPFPPTADYCVNETPSSRGFTLYESTAVTWTGGWHTSGDIGVGLTSQSGYSTGTELKYSFHVTSRLCGTEGYPASSPSRLVSESPGS